MFEAVRPKGIPVAYLLFRGSTTASARSRISSAPWRPSFTSMGALWGFDPADDIEPVEIENLD